MHDSPRIRRLRNDSLALERLSAESSVFRFSAHGSPPNHYQISFHGNGLYRHNAKVKTHDTHRIEIKLGSSYPRTIPEIRWLTPIYHPNISEIGMVCLGGYGTHWVPSVQLDELCSMLWDMLRYHNYDIRSPYNRDAALWVASQTTFLFPTDQRALRDRRVALGRISPPPPSTPTPRKLENKQQSSRSNAAASIAAKAARVREFLGKRYGRVFGEFVDEPEHVFTEMPRSSGLEDLARAELRSDQEAVVEMVAIEDEVVILDSAPARNVQTQQLTLAPRHDEIRFIE